MKSLASTIALLAMLSFAGLAQAAETSGRIISMDANMMVLEDGTAIAIPDGMDVSALQPGAQVMVAYEERDGVKVATEVQPAK